MNYDNWFEQLATRCHIFAKLESHLQETKFSGAVNVYENFYVLGFMIKLLCSYNFEFSLDTYIVKYYYC